MPGVIGALPLAVLGAPGVQLEDGLLEGGKDGRWVGGSSWGPQQCFGRGELNLHVLASLHEGADRVEGSSAASVQVGPVVGV